MLTEGTFQASNKRGHLSHGMDFQGTYAGQEQAKSNMGDQRYENMRRNVARE